IVGATGFESNKLDRCSERAKIDGKPRRRVLGMQRLAQCVVAAIDANAVPGDVSGRKKWEPHDVVPVGMRQEDVEAVLLFAAMLPQHVIADLAYSSAEIAQHIFITAGDELDAAGIAAESAAH